MISSFVEQPPEDILALVIANDRVRMHISNAIQQAAFLVLEMIQT